jgi:hypothetical protein
MQRLTMESKEYNVFHYGIYRDTAETISYAVLMQKLEYYQPPLSPTFQARFAEQIRSLSKISNLSGTWGIARQWLVMTMVFATLYVFRAFTLGWWMC